jgi:hypothetical protein
LAWATVTGLVACRNVLSIDEKHLVDGTSPSKADAGGPSTFDGSVHVRTRGFSGDPLARAHYGVDASPDSNDIADGGDDGSSASGGDAGDAGRWIVSTFIGNPQVAGTADGVGTDALVQSPWGLAVAGDHLYVQSWPGITRDVQISTAQTATLANEGAASGSVVLGGVLFITDWWNNSVWRLDLTTKAFALFAGSGLHTGSGAAGRVDATGTQARFSSPYGITTDGTWLYVTDVSATIRKIDPTNANVTTLVGAAYSIGSTNGSFAQTRFYYPVAIAYEDGKLYVTDTGNHDIRVIDLNAKTVSKLAGSGATGSDDGVGAAATFHWPYGVVPDGHGHLFITDNFANVIRKITIATAAVETIAGIVDATGHADGPGDGALFSSPQGIAIDAAGTLFVTEYGNHNVRKLVRQ